MYQTSNAYNMPNQGPFPPYSSLGNTTLYTQNQALDHYGSAGNNNQFYPSNAYHSPLEHTLLSSSYSSSSPLSLHPHMAKGVSLQELTGIIQNLMPTEYFDSTPQKDQYAGLKVGGNAYDPSRNSSEYNQVMIGKTRGSTNLIVTENT